MSKLNNKVQKIISSGRFSHFIHFFLVFTGIFVIMTTIILQIMRNGLYSNVDSSLSRISSKTDDYVEMVMGRSSLVNQDSEVSKSNNLNPKLSEQIVANTDIILFSDDGKILNADNIFFASWESLKLNKKYLSKIYEISLTNIFGHEEKYHIVTVKVKNVSYPDVKYMSVIINVDQLATANERYERIIIVVMATFWLISIGASVYLANWTRKPIIESYEKQKAFVENASHELRTPLAVLQNRLESLFRKPDSTILDNSESIASSLDEVRNMRILTTNLLNLARRDDGIKLVYAEITAKDIDAIFENYSLIAEENDKTFHAHNLMTAPFKSDKAVLKQLMTILFDNAIKYTGEDGVVDFTVKTTDKQVILTVADNGPGIKDSDKTKIFDRFYRVDKARTRQSGGFGLGLSLASQIASALKGTIEVKDNIPKGTIFEVHFSNK